MSMCSSNGLDVPQHEAFLLVFMPLFFARCISGSSSSPVIMHVFLNCFMCLLGRFAMCSFIASTAFVLIVLR